MKVRSNGKWLCARCYYEGVFHAEAERGLPHSHLMAGVNLISVEQTHQLIVTFSGIFALDGITETFAFDVASNYMMDVAVMGAMLTAISQILATHAEASADDEPIPGEECPNADPAKPVLH